MSRRKKSERDGFMGGMMVTETASVRSDLTSTTTTDPTNKSQQDQQHQNIEDDEGDALLRQQRSRAGS